MAAPPARFIFATPDLPASRIAQFDDPEPGLVETFSRCCLDLAWALWHEIKLDPSRWHREKDRKNFQEALGQLVLWESATLDLDKLLDAKEDLRTTILELLLGLGRLLLKWQDSPADSLDRRAELETLTTSIERAEFLVNGGTTAEEDDDDGDDDDDTSLSGSSGPETSLGPEALDPSMRHNRLRSSWIDTFLTYATCLMDLNPSAEGPVSGEANEERPAAPIKAGTGVSTSEAAQAFATKIYDIFPKADPDTVNKLATLNLERSIQIIQAQTRRRPMVIGDAIPQHKAVSEGRAASLAPSSAFHDSGIGTSAATMSHYSPSLASIVSEVSTSRLRVPLMPKESNGRGSGFICPLCGEGKFRIHSRADWKRHVYHDLGTYTCLKHSSEEKIEPFLSMNALAAHEFRYHRGQRQCSNCNDPIRSEEEWYRHTQQCADHDSPPSCILSQTSGHEERCSLCQESLGSDELQYSSHLGQHFEQISLASVPRNLMFTEDNNDEDEITDTADDDSERGYNRPRSQALLRGQVEAMHPANSNLGKVIGKTSTPTFQCHLCPKRFTRAYNLRSHLRTHTDERPFACSICSKAFARSHDCRRHESLHAGEKQFVCFGSLREGTWGCERRYTRVDALRRHFHTEAGRECIKPLLEEEAAARRSAATPSADIKQEIDWVPAALLTQYPGLGEFDWNQNLDGAEDPGEP